MAKITLPNGAVFEGTAKECAEFSKFNTSDDNTTSTKRTSKPSFSKGDDKPSSVKVNIKDYEPNCKRWGSYNSKRTKYCYAVATNGEVTDGKVYGTKWYDDIWKNGESASHTRYYKAKADFEKKFKYIKSCDR